MSALLDNPVFNALSLNDSRLGTGTDTAKWFDPEVSPFAGLADGYEKGFEELHELLPEGRTILYATRKLIETPKEWQQKAFIKGSQFVFDTTSAIAMPAMHPVSLGYENVEEMIALARLTKPGPFDRRTIDFGHYYGFFESGKLVAMTGQRLHFANYSEISAVCTHPDSLGKGYASALLQQQLQLITGEGKIPFLHVREDNARAIAVYERLGFKYNGPMIFYFLKKA
jgi:ribosomal protein S18 acetylase RimI-like enzyme